MDASGLDCEKIIDVEPDAVIRIYSKICCEELLYKSELNPLPLVLLSSWEFHCRYGTDHQK
jgi:hypothetical protein